MSGTIETYRGTVFPWECDFNGHMNVRFYVGKFDEGTWQLMSALGLTRDELARRNCSPMAVRQTIDYRRELVPGDTIVVRSWIGGFGRASFRFCHRMAAAQGDAVAAEMDAVGVIVDRERRKALPIWPELRQRAAAFLIEGSAP
jgi:acyl-CoA thioester hydrolase